MTGFGFSFNDELRKVHEQELHFAQVSSHRFPVTRLAGCTALTLALGA